MSYEVPETSERVAFLTLLGMAAAVIASLAVGALFAVVLMGAACLAGAVARIALPVGRSFAVRRRAIDVGLLVVFGGGLLFLGLTSPLG